jgi:hypothetical protein
MAVRVGISSRLLNPCIQKEYDLLTKQHQTYNADSDYGIPFTEFYREQKPYIKISFWQRQRTGDFSQRHPTIEDAITTTRNCLSEK